MTAEVAETEYLAFVDAVAAAAEGSVSRLGAGILAAVRMEIATDSRTFARLFGIAHALVLREITVLEGTGLLDIRSRDARTQRTFAALSPAGVALAERVEDRTSPPPLDAGRKPAT